MTRIVSFFALVGALAACRADGADTKHPDAAVPLDAREKWADCANTFGDELTDAFGRLDGTVLAIVPAGLQTCAQPNSTHLVLQVTMHGAAYRMVVNVGFDVAVHEVDAALAGPAWSEGWHTDAPLDYVTTLGVHSTDFAPVDTEAVISDAIAIGEDVSVFATSTGGVNAGNAHLVHRNTANADGAIVIMPQTSPHYVLFRFDTQQF